MQTHSSILEKNVSICLGILLLYSLFFKIQIRTFYSRDHVDIPTPTGHSQGR